MMARKDAASLLRHGLFAVNKVKDITSAETLNKIKELTLNGLEPAYRPGFIKMGHGGTLDKTAEGVLVVGVNMGCKELPILLQGTKNYVVTGQLGIATDTYNETGRVIDEKPYAHIKEEHVEQVIKQFVGMIWQTAPLYSALKVNSRRMSDWTMEGVQLEPKHRQVRCYSVELTDFNLPFFTLHIRSGGGFYVRSLVHDIGNALGSCAHVRKLLRTAQGPFTLQDCLNENEWTTENILDSILLCRLKFTNYCSRIAKNMG